MSVTDINVNKGTSINGSYMSQAHTCHTPHYCDVSSHKTNNLERAHNIDMLFLTTMISKCPVPCGLNIFRIV